MTEAELSKRIAELFDSMRATPHAGTASTGTQTQDGLYVPITEAISPNLAEALDDVRLQIKYLMFDLEATRRENRYLRQMLEARRRPARGEDDEREASD
jgi:hypothetical protein